MTVVYLTYSLYEKPEVCFNPKNPLGIDGYVSVTWEILLSRQERRVAQRPKSDSCLLDV